MSDADLEDIDNAVARGDYDHQHRLAEQVRAAFPASDSAALAERVATLAADMRAAGLADWTSFAALASRFRLDAEST